MNHLIQSPSRSGSCRCSTNAGGDPRLERAIRFFDQRFAERAGRSRVKSFGRQPAKIVVGKWLSHGAELFIFDEPTVGVDVGTKFEFTSSSRPF